jgi:hypothetical protein
MTMRHSCVILTFSNKKLTINLYKAILSKAAASTKEKLSVRAKELISDKERINRVWLNSNGTFPLFYSPLLISYFTLTEVCSSDSLLGVYFYHLYELDEKFNDFNNYQSYTGIIPCLIPNF